jgi:hypothetical protein
MTRPVRNPRARAANAKDFLAFLEGFRPGTREHLRRALPPEVWEALEATARTDWIPVGLDGPYVTEVVRWLGPEASLAASRAYTSQSLVRSAAMRAIVDGAVRLFGLSVGSLLRIFPVGFQQNYRDFADVQVQRGEGEATVTFSDLAPAVARHPAYAVLFHGAFVGIYDVVQAEPRLAFRAELDELRIVAHFRW